MVVDWDETVDMTFAANALGFPARCMGFRTDGKLNSQALENRDNAAVSIRKFNWRRMAGLIAS